MCLKSKLKIILSFIPLIFIEADTVDAGRATHAAVRETEGSLLSNSSTILLLSKGFFFSCGVVCIFVRRVCNIFVCNI